MEFFQKAEKVRLRGRRDKHLIAADDEETVVQCRNGSNENAVWTVELVEGRDVLRLKSCHGKYLTASPVPFIPGVAGKKVIQTVPENNNDPLTEWEPVRDGFQVRFKTLRGNYLRPNGGLPPWRNSITHDPPHRNRTYEKALWDVEVVEERPEEEEGGHRRSRSDVTFERVESSAFARSRSIRAAALLLSPRADKNSLER